MSFLPVGEENKEAPVGQTTNQPGQPGGQPPPATSGGSVGAGQGGGGAAGSANGSPTQFGSSASKLGDYLSANAPQVQTQANQMATGLNNQYSNLNQGITNAANQFQQQVGAGYNPGNQDVVKNATADPTKFASDPNNIKAFQAQYNDQYTGPTDFVGSQGYGDIQGKVNQAVQQGNLLNTSAGLQSYLQNQSMGGPNNTTATNTLDTLLMQGNPNASKTIQQAANQFGGLTGQLDTAAGGANDSVAAAQKAAQDAQAYARGQFDPYVQNFGNQINQGAQQAEAGRTKYNENLQNILSQATTANTALNGFMGSSNLPFMQGTPNTLSSIFSNQPVGSPITAANYSTPEQYVQAAALQQLAGNQQLNLPLDQSLSSQAGTASAVPGSLPDLDSAIAKQFNPILANYYRGFGTGDIAGTYNGPGDNGVTAKNLAALMGTIRGINPNNPNLGPHDSSGKPSSAVADIDRWLQEQTPPNLNVVNTPTPVVEPPPGVTYQPGQPTPGINYQPNPEKPPLTGINPTDSTRNLTSDQLKQLMGGK